MENNQSLSNNSSLFNTTTPSNPPPLEWTVLHTIQSLILGSIVTGTIVGNFIAIVAFLKYPQFLRSPTHYFLANLALADFFVGLLALPYLAVFSVTFRWYFGPEFCVAWTILHFTMCSSSILSTLGICVERYIGVRFPLRHRTIMNRRVIFSAIVGIWILAVSLAGVPFLIWPAAPIKKPLYCKIPYHIGQVITSSVGIFYIPATAMVILYYLVYRAAKTSMQAISKTGEAHSSSNRDQQVTLAKKLTFLVGFLILSYFPMFTAFFGLQINPNFVPIRLFIVFAWIRYFNSCLNPIIYAFSIPGYKKAFREMFGLKERTGEKIENTANSTVAFGNERKDNVVALKKTSV